VHFIGIDLHKKTISLCVMSKGRKASREEVLRCDGQAGISAIFRGWKPFRAVVEATARFLHRTAWQARDNRKCAEKKSSLAVERRGRTSAQLISVGWDRRLVLRNGTEAVRYRLPSFP
jgi:hypothetical protein